MPNSAMPAMSRLVAIGRRMKISETFTDLTEPDPTLTHPTDLTHLARVPVRRVRVRDPRPAPAAGVRGDARALFEAQLSLGHDHFARLQPFVDHQILVHALSGRDRPLFDG